MVGDALTKHLGSAVAFQKEAGAAAMASARPCQLGACYGSLCLKQPPSPLIADQEAQLEQDGLMVTKSEGFEAQSCEGARQTSPSGPLFRERQLS